MPVNFVPYIPALHYQWWSCGLQELFISPPCPHLPPANSADTSKGLKLISGLSQLEKLTYPLDTIDGLNELLPVLSTLPHFCNLVLLPPSSSKLPRWTKGVIIADMVKGLRHFDHLQRLTLPADILSDRLLNAMGTMSSLQELTLTSPRGQTYRPAAEDQFRALRRLKVSGTLSESANIVAACFYASTSVPRTVVLVANSLQYEDEMRESLQVVAAQCPGLRSLQMDIHHVQRLENRRWINITPLRGCVNLKELIINHPHHPLSGVDIA
jgi:hypothetical protein